MIELCAVSTQPDGEGNLNYNGTSVALAALGGMFFATVVAVGIKIREIDKRQNNLAMMVDQRITGVAEGLATRVEEIGLEQAESIQEVFHIQAQILEVVTKEEE